MTKEELEKYEIGKEYWFKLNNRKNRKRGILIDKDSVFTGLSVYHGTEAITFKKKNTEYTISLHGLTSIELVN